MEVGVDVDVVVAAVLDATIRFRCAQNHLVVAHRDTHHSRRPPPVRVLRHVLKGSFYTVKL